MATDAHRQTDTTECITTPHRQVTITISSATEKIARDTDETAIQGHSRSSVVVSMYAGYMTSH